MAPESQGEAVGRLPENVIGFCRTLRQAGVPVGPGEISDALLALRATGIERRDDAYRALRAVLVKDPAHFRVFRQAFHVWFRNPGLLERIPALVLPPDAGSGDAGDEPPVRRLLEALAAGERERVDDTTEIDRSMTWSSREVLAQKDFEQMTVAELGAAKELLRTQIALLEDVPTRRFRPSAAGRGYDLRRSMQRMLRNDGQLLQLVRKRRVQRPPSLVLICDISGSMSRYSRMFLHFAHALGTKHRNVATFVFATRLTNISRRLEDKDIDRALARVTGEVADWDGGTRIAGCLERFNIDWGRRVLAQNAVAILLSDGLERDSESNLEFQMQRLRLSCRRLIWLNPMLRYSAFEAKASGIRKMLPHVDLFLPAHNVDSLAALSRLLGEAPARDGPPRRLSGASNA
ncbi:MAG TPA: VWA domain-containing protein [Woeseiaceae bacterium]|nr:VWA domain-containing protein [Woeseiaceae bacterium]